MMLEEHQLQQAASTAAPEALALATTPGLRAYPGASQASQCASRRGLGELLFYI